MRRHTARLTVLGLLLAAVPVGAGAQEIPSQCTPGSVLTASATAPHGVDPAGDQTLPGPTHGDPTDLRGLWITGEDGTAVIASTSTPGLLGGAADVGVASGRQLTANIAVSAITTHPVNASYRVTFAAGAQERFVAAQAMPDGAWQFTHGVIDTESTPGVSRQVRLGSTAGSVDTAAGIISIDLVGDFQAYPADTTAERRLTVNEVRSQLLVGNPFGDPTGAAPASGLLVASDTTANGQLCRVVVFAAGEELPKEVAPEPEPEA
jgi:hypothetical protein